MKFKIIMKDKEKKMTNKNYSIEMENALIKIDEYIDTFRTKYVKNIAIYYDHIDKNIVDKHFTDIEENLDNAISPHKSMMKEHLEKTIASFEILFDYFNSIEEKYLIPIISLTTN